MVVELGFEPKSCSPNFTGLLLPGVLAADPFDLLTSAYVNGNQLLGAVLRSSLTGMWLPWVQDETQESSVSNIRADHSENELCRAVTKALQNSHGHSSRYMIKEQHDLWNK